MSAMGMLVRAVSRRQLGSFLVLAIVGGLGTAFAMTAVAGARRTDSAYDRLRNVPHSSGVPGVIRV
jgi:hypothetical protein